MSTRGQPPNPAQYRSVAQWASQMYEFLSSQTEVGASVDPQPVLLPHMVNGVTARATTEGILLYNPTTSNVVVSINNEFVPIISENDVLSPAEKQAERVVLSTYGDVVSIVAKAKNLSKFGTNAAVGTAFETIAQFQGTVANETFVNTNLITHAVSSSASDVGLVLVHEGHTIDAFGNLTFIVETVTLNGQTPVALTTARARQSRIYVADSGVFGSPQASPVGTVYFYDNSAAGGVTAGVPNTALATKCLLAAGENQSQKCATSTSSTDYYFIKSVDAGIGAAGGAANRVLVRVETRDVKNGGVWLPKGRDLTLDIDQNGVQQEEEPLVIVPPNHDVRVRAQTDSNTAATFAEIRGVLASVQT